MATGSALALFLLAAGAAGCNVAIPGDDEDDGDDDGETSDGESDGDDEGGPPPRIGPEIYVRGSLVPNFDLPDVEDKEKFEIPTVQVVLDDGNGQQVVTDPEPLNDNQFICQGSFVSVQSKMAEVAKQISDERDAQVTVIPPESPDDSLAQKMPWRANPTDVDCVEVGGERKCIVPLGGGVSTPGNTVAIVSGTDVTEIDVGVRPVRTTCHPEGVCFVANQYSNYLSVIDMVREERLLNGEGAPVEIPVDYYTSDVLLVETSPGGDNDEENYLFLANEWLGTVNRYDIRVIEGGLDAGIEDVVRVNPDDDPVSTPDHVIAGVGSNPQRLKLDEQQKQVYVANGRGGEVAVIDAAAADAFGYTGVGAPSVDIIEVDGSVFVTTTMPDRGLLAREEAFPDDFEEGQATDPDTGAVSHEGALFDRTRAYNFEDVKTGITALSPNLDQRDVFQQTYFTDTINVDENINPDQRVLTATLVGAAETDGQGRLFVAGEGNDTVQVLDVEGGADFPLRLLEGAVFETGIRPMAMFVDTNRQELVVVTWGSGTLETYSLNEFTSIDRVDLGYAQDNGDNIVDGTEYPCSDLEIGEFAYINTTWSNNGIKSCVSCHRDELMTDGGGYSNGVTAPTTYHKVIPCWNQTKTDNYFWTGSFTNDSYLSLAFSAQTRTNCELIAFGLTEGPGSDPDAREGDPNNQVSRGKDNDAICRPGDFVQEVGLPENFADIAAEIARQKFEADRLITEQITDLVDKDQVNVAGQARPLNRVELSRLIDWWMTAQVRLPPNAMAYVHEAQQAGDQISGLIERGEAVFAEAGCNGCHDPDNATAPYTDLKSHGRGADWASQFVARYDNAEALVDFTNAQEIKDAAQRDRGSTADEGEEINVHLQIDGFMPFAFDSEDALLFEDPLGQALDTDEEVKRRELIELINLNDPERGHVPGYVIGQPKINTPSLRGVWWNPNYLHNAMAKTFREAVVAPGHPALRSEGEDALFLMNGAHPNLGTEERGWAVNAAGERNAHGLTADLSDEDLRALEFYVNAIP